MTLIGIISHRTNTNAQVCCLFELLFPKNKNKRFNQNYLAERKVDYAGCRLKGSSDNRGNL